MKLIKLTILFCLTVVLIMTSQPLTIAQNSMIDQEIRGVWLTNIDSEILFSPEKTTEAIENLSRLNFNSLYPTVWNWGYTLYPSEVAKQVTGIKIDPEEGLQNRDVLEEVIEQGHQHNMAVIPWFEFGFMAPADSKLAQLHPDWLTSRRDGSTIWLEGKVHERVWLNPLHPEVQEFISKLLLELVRNYDVDGIQLDDHFGYPSQLGYDSYTVGLYRQEHNGKLPPIDSKNPEWVQWRADKITAYMESLFKQIKAVKQDVIISVSPNPQEFSKEEFLLDWAKWERKGLIEELIVQLYRNNMEAFNRELAQPDLQLAKAHIPTAIGILSGLKGRPTGLRLLQQKIDRSRQEDFAGVSFFFYESLWNFGTESVVQRQNFFQKMFYKKVKRAEI
jgi:uncharacterized lipoprotein YddW (UPF0748 family)